MVRKALAGCTISILGRNPSWSSDQHKKIGGWLSHLSGRLNAKFDKSVTHLVVSHKRWKEEPKPKPVQDALDQINNGRDVKIVTFSWLEDCLNSQMRKREVPYEWINLDAQEAKKSAKGKKAATKAAEKAERDQGKSGPGMLSEVFHESTEKFVDPREKERMDRELERERQEKKERDAKLKADTIRKRKEQALLFGAGAKQSRDILLSDRYHLYVDTTGFKYDVLVTKINIRLNQNERWALTLQLFESNDEPHTYAMNAQISGTKTVPANNVICAAGSNFLTAFHAFESEFQRLTGWDWDARLSLHVKRLRKHDEGVGTGSAHGSVRGVPVSESAVAQANAPAGEGFEYHPPGYGPKGEVTAEEKARMKDLGVTVVDSGLDKFGNEDGDPKAAAAPKRASEVLPIEGRIDPGTRQEVEKWIDGADLDAVPPPQSQSHPQQNLDDVDFDAMMAEHEYPFEKTGQQQNVAPVTQNPSSEDVGAAETYGEIEALMTPNNANAPIVDVANGPLDGLQQQLQDEAPFQADAGIGNGREIDWEAVATDMAGDPAWLEAQLAELESGDQIELDQSQPDQLQQLHDSLQAEMPSFTTHPTNETFFQHGTQAISETQIADKAGGEFLEELGVEQQQQPTPPASTKKTGMGGTAEGGEGSVSSFQSTKAVPERLDFGNSVLSKRKTAPEEVGGDACTKKAKVVDAEAES